MRGLHGALRMYAIPCVWVSMRRTIVRLACIQLSRTSAVLRKNRTGIIAALIYTYIFMFICWRLRERRCINRIYVFCLVKWSQVTRDKSINECRCVIFSCRMTHNYIASADMCGESMYTYCKNVVCLSRFGLCGVVAVLSRVAILVFLPSWLCSVYITTRMYYCIRFFCLYILTSVHSWLLFCCQHVYYVVYINALFCVRVDVCTTMSAVKRSLNVGVAGMGNMGIAIVRNLAFKARSAMYIQIHSRTLSKARKVCDDLGVDGATCAMRIHDRYRTLTKWCDVILLTLANRSAARHVLLEDAEALLPHARPGQIIVDHTTVDVELSRECAHVAQSRGAVFLDVPMSGSPRAAFNGQLVLMAGGPRDSFQRMLPIFRLYADTIHHMGECGSGSATKLLSQALVAAHNAAAAEAMTIANRLGIEDHSKLVQVLDASWGSSTMLRRNAPTMQDLIRSPDKVPPPPVRAWIDCSTTSPCWTPRLPRRDTLPCTVISDQSM